MKRFEILHVTELGPVIQVADKAYSLINEDGNPPFSTKGGTLEGMSSSDIERLRSGIGQLDEHIRTVDLPEGRRHYMKGDLRFCIDEALRDPSTVADPLIRYVYGTFREKRTKTD